MKRTEAMGRLCITSLLVVFTLLMGVIPQKGHAQNGQKLFRNNCASCHKTSSQKLVGPGLKGVTERRSMDWLIEWTKNSQKLIKSGDEQAVKLFKKYNEQVMPAQNLSKDEIKAVYDFIESGGKKAATASKKKSDDEQAAKKVEAPMPISGKLTLYWYGVLAVMAFILFIATMHGALKTLRWIRYREGF